MKILVLGDIHFDFWLRSGRNPFAGILHDLEGLDALILAGDIANSPQHGWPNFFGWLANVIDLSKVWVLPGNQDYYGFRLDGDDELREIAAADGVTFLQKEVLVFGDVRLLCCTLWTDFCLTGDRRAALAFAYRSMNDFNLIQSSEGGSKIAPDDLLELHDDHLAWLDAELQKPFAGKTVVVTHHGPSPAAAGDIDGLTPAFSSNLDPLILRHQPHAWLFGHTHRHLRAKVGVTEVRNVSLGYPGEVRAGLERRILLSGLIDTDSEDLLQPRA